MSVHPIIASFMTGHHLISREGMQTHVPNLELVFKSDILSNVDIMSASLPKTSESMSSEDDFWPRPDDWFSVYRPYNVKNGILVIPVRGVLIHGVSITFGRYFTGFEYLMRAVMRGIADEEVKSIVFRIDSPGGSVASCFDFCDMVATLGKPTLAFVEDTACSAGYAIAASCDTIVATQTCNVGNIGVLTGYADYTDALAKAGVKYHYIYSPDDGLKADGHFGSKVSKEFMDMLQEGVDGIYEIFSNCVTRKRKITAKEVRDTKSKWYRKDDALRMNLIDAIGSPVDIMKIAADIFEGRMGGDTETGAGDEIAQKHEETEMDKEELAKLEAAAKSNGAAEGAAAAKARISTILGSEQGKKNPALAQHFAFNTDMSAEDAAAALTVANESAAAAAPVAPPAPGVDAAAKKAAEDAAAAKAAAEQMQASFDAQMSQAAPNLSGNEGGDEGANGGTDESAKSISASLALAKSAGMPGYHQ